MMYCVMRKNAICCSKLMKKNSSCNGTKFVCWFTRMSMMNSSATLLYPVYAQPTVILPRHAMAVQRVAVKCVVVQARVRTQKGYIDETSVCDTLPQMEQYFCCTPMKQNPFYIYLQDSVVSSSCMRSGHFSRRLT